MLAGAQVPRYGTWTPQIRFAVVGTSAITHDRQVGWWYRNGLLVRIGWEARTSAFTVGTATGALELHGNPFTHRNVTNENEIGPVTFGGITRGTMTQLNASLVPNSAIIGFVASGSGQAAQALTAADTFAAAVLLRGNLEFMLAA